MRWLLVVAALGGCIRDQLGTCGDQVCPAGDVCVPGGCATPAEAAACAGAQELDACTTPQIAIGTCHGGACRETRCGNGVVDRGEVCDDGNLAYGDGCSGDCLSTEVCGNGIVDPIRGEQCDSGIVGLSGDGCASRCSVELEDWRQVPTGVPGPRQQSTLVFDGTGLVAFGGITSAGEVLGDTWRWNGTTWLHPLTPTQPPARFGAATVYDRVRKRVVLFGGLDVGGNALGDTWEWDGLVWHQLTPLASPPPRSGAAVAYDVDRDRVVLFGGLVGTNTGLADTWEWDGTTWTEVASSGPPGRFRGGLAYDQLHHQIVLFGGFTTGVVYNDTWVWNGTTWTDAMPAAAPGARGGHAMAFDEAGQSVLVYAGLGNAIRYSDTWSWNGTTWTQLAPATSPPFQVGMTATFDPGTQRVVLFAGNSNSITFYNDLWTWTGATWTQLVPLQASTNIFYAMVYDARHAQTILYDGAVTWAWDGTSWSRIATSGPPGLRNTWSLAYEERAGKILMFGGGGTANDTWEWDGTSWTQRTPATNPPARFAHGLAYDRRRDRVVMFGGNAGGPALGDTWEWDGTDWTQVVPAVSPPARYNHALVYDPVLDRTILHGGTVNPTTDLGDTWTWDGTSWVDVTPADVSQLIRAQPRAVFDPRRERTVLVGGWHGMITYSDAWTWNGGAWTLEQTTTVPPARRAFALGTDVTGHVVMFAGNVNGTRFTDTWRLAYESNLVASEACVVATDDLDGDGLAGCADPDCWTRCAPLCPPGLSCDPAAPRCGDNVCDPAEDTAICPSDCRP